MSTAAERRIETGWSPFKIVAETLRGFRADRGLDLAGSLAFTTLLTAIPLLATFSLFLATLFRQNDVMILSIVNSVLPYQTARLTRNLTDFIAQASAISGVGLALLVVASVRLVWVVEGVFNAVWGAPRRAFSFSRILITLFALLCLGLVLGGVGAGLRAIQHWTPMSSVWNAPALGAAASFLLKAVALSLLYRYLPNARVRWRPAISAGAAVAVALELLRLAFGVYVEALDRMNLITGSLAFIFFAVLSLYFVWALILIGVELTHVVQLATTDSGPGSGTEGLSERAVRMLLRMSPVEPLPVARIGGDRPAGEVVAILEALERAGIVRGNAVRGFELALPAWEITVGGVVDALSPGLYRVDPLRRDRIAQILEPLFLRLDGERRALLGATLADLKRR